MNKEKLIGRKVRGFKFKRTKSVDYLDLMDKFIGKVGVIKGFGDYNYIIVEFEDKIYSYPADQIEKHLVEEDLSKCILSISSFKNPILFDGAKDLIDAKEFKEIYDESSNKLFKEFYKSLNKKTKEMTEEQRNKKVEKLQAKIDKLKAMDFKPKLAKSWEDLECVSGCIVSNSSYIENVFAVSSEKNKNIFATEKQAKSMLAYAQLTQLMKQANGDWVADWSDFREEKWCVTSSSNGLIIGRWNTGKQFVALKDQETAEHFLEHHKDLLNDYFMH